MSACGVLRKWLDCGSEARYEVELRCSGCGKSGRFPCCVKCAADLRNEAKPKDCAWCKTRIEGEAVLLSITTLPL